MLDKLRNDSFVAFTLGGIFIAITILGYIPNPVVGENELFVVNGAHNLVHFLSGVLLLAGAWMNRGKSVLLLLGVIYVVVAVLGLLSTGDMLLGVIKINGPDRWLHFVLAVVIAAGGVYVKPSKR